MRTRGRRGLENVFEFPKNNEIARSRSTRSCDFVKKGHFFVKKGHFFVTPRLRGLNDWMTG